MKIFFVVNTLGLTGGIKVIFEHANGLSRFGHDVSIVHLLRLRGDVPGFFVAILKKIKYLLLGFARRGGVSWFTLEADVKLIRAMDLAGIQGDAIIATANETADWVVRSEFGERKYYFVQDYENWTRKDGSVDATYRMPLEKIVISDWLRAMMADKFGQPVAGVVVNGIDSGAFRCEGRPPRKNKKILMLYHILPKKGTDIGIKALLDIKKIFPEVEVDMFGAYKPHGLPPFVRYHFRPDLEGNLKKLYCESDIYLLPSLQEGCALTPMEAMASGCAVVATDVGGVRDYAVDGETALIVPPGDPDLLAKALRMLLEDEKRLASIARSGMEYVRRFSWEQATRNLEKILLK